MLSLFIKVYNFRSLANIDSVGFFFYFLSKKVTVIYFFFFLQIFLLLFWRNCTFQRVRNVLFFYIPLHLLEENNSKHNIISLTVHRTSMNIKKNVPCLNYIKFIFEEHKQIIPLNRSALGLCTKYDIARNTSELIALGTKRYSLCAINRIFFYCYSQWQ